MCSQKPGKLSYQGELTESEISQGMALAIRTSYPRELNNEFGAKFQEISPEVGCSVEQPKRREHDNKFEANSPNVINSEHNQKWSSLKYEKNH